MPYLRRLVLLLTLSTSILLVTIHLLHFSRPRHQQEPLHPVITKEEAEKDFNYLKQYDHPKEPSDMTVPNPDYAAKIAFGKDKATPPKKEDVHVPEQKDKKPKPDPSKAAPANATAWHKDKNLWKVGDALQR